MVSTLTHQSLVHQVKIDLTNTGSSADKGKRRYSTLTNTGSSVDKGKRRYSTLTNSWMFKSGSNISNIRSMHTTTKARIRSCNDVNKFTKVRRLNTSMGPAPSTLIRIKAFRKVSYYFLWS